jgi:hypothetical protein
VLADDVEEVRGDRAQRREPGAARGERVLELGEPRGRRRPRLEARDLRAQARLAAQPLPVEGRFKGLRDPGLQARAVRLRGAVAQPALPRGRRGGALLPPPRRQEVWLVFFGALTIDLPIIFQPLLFIGPKCYCHLWVPFVQN